MGKKILSSIAFYSGKFIGKALGTLATLLNMLSFGVFTKSDSWTGSWRRLFGQSFTQKKKTRKNIPGWEDAAKVLSRWLLWIFKNRVNSKIRDAVAEAVTNKRGPVMTKIDTMIDELLNENL